MNNTGNLAFLIFLILIGIVCVLLQPGLIHGSTHTYSLSKTEAAIAYSLDNCSDTSFEQTPTAFALILIPTRPQPQDYPSPPPSSDVPIIAYGLLGTACALTAGWLLFRYMHGGWRQSVKKKPFEVKETIASGMGRLPYGAWCICPTCGSYICANIDYCTCGTKLPRRS